VPAGRYEGVTRSIDVFPTLASLSGVTLSPNATMGVDLTPAILGPTPPPTLIAYSHTALMPRAVALAHYPSMAKRFPRNDASEMWVGARDGNVMYKITSEDGVIFVPHVYDWEKDPTERNDLYDPTNEVHATMIRRLADYKAALREGFSYWSAAAEGHLPTEQEEQMLRSLGYIQ
jgi:hypothetical protein